jgi:putative ABC transport system permease protein
MPAPGQERFVSPETFAQLQRDPSVLEADPMWAQRAMVMPYNPETFRRVRPATRPAGATLPSQPGPTTGPGTGPGLGGPRGRGGVMLIGSDAPLPPYAVLRGRWIDANKPDVLEAALSADAAERLGVDLGGEVSAGAGERAQKLTVVGIIDVPLMPGGNARGAPQARGPSSGGLYVPMKLAETILGRPAQISFVSLVLKPEANVISFRFGWQPKLNASEPPLQFQNARELEEELNASATAENLKMQAYAATGISLLAALFIIFATLNMGVSERARQFAILRAVALTRAQIAALISIESLFLAIAGWIGGLATGWVLLWLLTSNSPSLSKHGVVLGRWSLLLSAACAFGGAILASVVPALRAMRMRPLDAIAPRPMAKQTGIKLAAASMGILLILANPLFTFVLPVSEMSQYATYSTIGSSLMAIGFILVAPLIVHVVEFLVAPAMSRFMRLEPRLLQTQLSSNLRRTVGTATSLSVGLGLYVSMQVWGYTMLRPFVPGDWVPDVLVGVLTNGLPPDRLNDVAHLPGIDPLRCLPLAVEQPKLTDDITGSASRATVTRQDNIVLIGIDPDRGIAGDSPLLQFEWAEGDPATAAVKLKDGRGIIVPDHFCRETGLKIGDTFRVNPPGDDSQPIQYTIAGISRLPGWHWMTKLSGLRMNSGRSAAMCFADYETVRRDFHQDKIKFFWADATGPIDSAALAETTRQLAEKITGEAFVLPAPGLALNDAGNLIRVTTPDDVRTRIRGRADGWIWSLSQLPLVTLAVASIGVLNAILASVRARTWDMGVLRALGFTRFTLVRLIIAEGLLVGVIACVLSVSFGIIAGWCGSGISQHVSFFGGLRPMLVIPWYHISIGLALALGLCLAASLWPAIQTGRAKPLTLLQAGRTAF